MRVVPAAGVVAALISGVPSASAADAQIERQVREQVESIRSVRPANDAGRTRELNRRMDDAWRYFEAHRAVAIPVLRSTLTREVADPHRSDLVLLDEGYFLYSHGAAADKEVAKNALFALDPEAEVVRLNQGELFQFAHAVAGESDSRILPWLDKVFLRGAITAFIPQHALKLDETLVCAFLYGAHGGESEAHLAAMLSDARVSRRALEVLVWLGTPESVPAVTNVMRSRHDYDTFARATSFLMKVGGPQGRKAMLDMNVRDLDPAAREYYGKIRPAVEATSYEAMHAAIEKLAGPLPLKDEEVRARLAAMIANQGRDDRMSPVSIIDSRLPRSYLVEQMRRVRQVTFRRISDEALSDVEIDNALLNALYYRPY